MKKKYEKPQVLFEKYELTHSVANCGAALNHTENSCELGASEAPNLFLQEGETIFNGSTCTYTIDDLGISPEDYCYWTGESVNNIFTS